MIGDDPIPYVELYKNVPIFDRQPRSRIERIVKPAIDVALSLERPMELHELMIDADGVPEARAVAAARLLALFQKAAAERRAAPDIGPLRDMPYVECFVEILTAQHCRNHDNYNAWLDPRPSPEHPGAGRREPAWEWYDQNPGVIPP
jgi:hypothetical protein